MIKKIGIHSTCVTSMTLSLEVLSLKRVLFIRI
jgi:hypothetical protein